MTRALLASCIVPLAFLLSTAHAGDDVDPAKVERTADLAAAREAGVAERVIAEVAAGSLELVVDPNISRPRIEAEFTVDGEDEKDVKRRSELVKLFAERVADQTIVVQPMFPGKPMERDAARIRITVPKAGDASLKGTKGAVKAVGTSGKLKASTKEGAIRIERHAGSVDASADAGAIEIVDAGGEVRVAAGDGAVTVVLADGNDLPFDIETRNGLVRLEVGADFDGIVKMHSTSGKIDLSDPGKRARVPQSSDHSKTVEIGAAGGHSEVRTTAGAIKLKVRAK
jgi:hypothetical protein